MIIYKTVRTEDELEEMYRLRYRVACQERLLEPEESHQSGRIQDTFDEHSIHVIARHFDLVPVGTLRLVRGTPIGLPVQRSCGIAIPDQKRSGELSRLAISRLAITVSGARQREILMGLVRVLCLEGAGMGINHWYMVLTQSMLRLLSHYEIRPLPVRASIACRDGLPYMIGIGDLETLLFLQDFPDQPFVNSSAPTAPSPSCRPKPPRCPTLLH